MQQPLAALDGSHAFPIGTFSEVLDFLTRYGSRDGEDGRKFNRVRSLEKGRPALGKADMPRYFFNVYHDRAELDEEGEELPDVQAAWHEATVTAGQIIQDLDGRLRPGRDWRLEVTDEFANPLYVIHVSAHQPK
jgi:hypothetical protein